MDMSLISCCDCGPSQLEAMVYFASVFVLPVGAFVLRKRIADARGAWRLAGRTLQTLGIIAAPLAAVSLLWIAT